MTDAKISFKVGGIEFSGEGDKDWLSQQLDKILEQAADLSKIAPQSAAFPIGEGEPQAHTPMGPDPKIAQQTLASFLKDKNAVSDQTRKFLATSVWLEARGKNRLTVKDITTVLRDTSHKRLGNASQCLTNNINKGYCERDGKEFYVTEEGKQVL